LLATGLVLLAVGVPVGLAVLRVGGAGAATGADRLVVAAWTGLLALGSVWLAASVVVPLTPLVGGALAAGLVAASLVRAPSVRVRARPRGLGAAVAILTVTSALFSRRVDLFDTGLYHAGIVEWLARFGTVPGVALLHGRLGFSSSWLALAAPFDAGFLHGRTLAALGTVAVALAVVHLILAGQRVLVGDVHPSDLFLVLGLAVVLVIVPDDLMVSPSPDLPVAVLAVEVAWLVARAFEGQDHDADLLAAALLGVGAAGVKLSALPLAAVAAGVALRRVQQWRWIPAAAALVLPTLVGNTVASGCPLFPARPCLDAAWRVPGPELSRLTDAIRDFGWDSIETSAVVTVALTAALVAALVAAVALLGHRPAVGAVVALAVVGLASRELRGVLLCAAGALALWSVATARLPGFRLLAGTALVGIALVVVTGPLLRFAFGFVAVALAVAGTGVLLPAVPAIGARAVRRYGLLAAGLVAAGSIVYRGPSTAILPPPLPEARVRTVTTPGFAYAVPIRGTRCWQAALPCASRPVPDDRRLRSPDEGIAGGFVRAGVSGSPRSGPSP
jgi:hypothetical protein